MPTKVRDMKRMARKTGWIFSHTTGSHHQFYHPDRTDVLTIPEADHKELYPITERSIRKR